MTHSVSQHLRVEIREYDATIRRFIPGYDEMLDRAVAAVAAAAPALTLDLGAGTGALTERLLARTEAGAVELWDVDAAMLDVARTRLARYGDRARFVARSFGEAFPPAGAIMASLALHHVRELPAKAALYRRAAEALAPGGVLAIADITIPADKTGADATYRVWADHQVANGFAEEQAWRHFEEWSGEDRYFSLDEELSSLRDAGLLAEVRWQQGPATVLTGTRPS